MRIKQLALVGMAAGIMFAAALGAPAQPVAASVVPWGTVLVPGPAWAGAEATRGDLNVYSNGTGFQDQQGVYGLEYECVELAVRWAQVAFGVVHSTWAIAYASQMWSAGPHLSPAFIQHPNGGADGPQFGDLMVFASTTSDPTGHIAVVAGVSPGNVDVVEQNYNNNSPTGKAQLPIYGTTMPDRYGLPILGWLRSSTAPPGWRSGGGPGGYVAAATGKVYAYGSAASPSEQTVWPTAATATAMALIPKTPSGYVLDSYGGLHSFGGSARLRPSGYWFGQDLARALALTPGGRGGYVLDAYGGLHPVGAAQTLATSGSWPGWDIARAMVLRADGLGGWVLDGWGGMHAFGNAPAVRLNSPYFPNQDVVRAACLRSDGVSGWWVDGSNGIQSFGGAPAVTSTRTFPGQDVARSMMCSDDGGGYTLTTAGAVLPFGDAAPVWSAPALAGLASALAG